MQVRRQSTGQTIALNHAGELGAGGEAKILPVFGTDKLVAKIYHRPDHKHLRKLEAMLANPPQDPASSLGRISIAWPTDILHTCNGNQDFLGFLMPRVNDLRSLMEVYNPQSRKKFCPLFTYAYLLRAARNLASAVSELHTANCVLGDINESNNLVSSDALITLVDTDSFQIRDARTSETYRCPVGKGEFTPPELQGETFTDVYRKPEHDLFGLGVLIFQLLMEGTHPFSGVPVNDDDAPLETRIRNGNFPHGSRKVPYRPMPAAPPFKILSPELQALFIRCFEDGYADPQRRPDARTWHNNLDKAEALLVTCSVNHQHVYGDHLASCPWCERKKLLQGRDPFPSAADVKTGRHLNRPHSPPKPPTSKGASPTPTPIKHPPVWPSTPSKRRGQNPLSRATGCLVWFLVIGAISSAQKNCSQLGRSATPYYPAPPSEMPPTPIPRPTPIPTPDYPAPPSEMPPTPSPTPIPRPTPIPTPDSKSKRWPDGRILKHPERFVSTCVVNVPPNDVLKLRSGPGTRFRAITELPADAADIFAFDKDAVWDGDTWWYPIEWHGFRGYVGGSYLPHDQ